MSGPYGVGTDSSGNVYVADSFNHRIEKFSSSGVYLAKFGSQGSANGKFSFPRDVAIDGSGNISIAGQVNNRVQKFNSSGGFLLKFGSTAGSTYHRLAFHPVHKTVTMGTAL